VCSGAQPDVPITRLYPALSINHYYGYHPTMSRFDTLISRLLLLSLLITTIERLRVEAEDSKYQEKVNRWNTAKADVNNFSHSGMLKNGSIIIKHNNGVIPVVDHTLHCVICGVVVGYLNSTLAKVKVGFGAMKVVKDQSYVSNADHHVFGVGIVDRRSFPIVEKGRVCGKCLKEHSKDIEIVPEPHELENRRSIRVVMDRIEDKAAIEKQYDPKVDKVNRPYILQGQPVNHKEKRVVKGRHKSRRIK
jgi:hypothetical protein